tara:strand:+ start:1483 stop:1731 length:249 start_codon:yes stop_codon:yes gene_type:complete
MADDTRRYIIVPKTESDKIDRKDSGNCSPLISHSQDESLSVVVYNSEEGTPNFLSTLSEIQGPYDTIGISTIVTKEWLGADV